jgi:hypothetical protein
MRGLKHVLFGLALLMGVALVADAQRLTRINGSALFADGTASTPSLSFASDTDTGFYWVSSGFVRLAINGGNVHGFDGSTYTLASNSAKIQLGANADAGLLYGGAGLLSITDADSTPVVKINASGSPTLSTCGDGALATGSSNTSGRVTGTTQTACTLTFSASFGGNSADCIMENMTTNGVGRVTAASSTAFTVSALTAGDDFMYICLGR